MEKQSENLFFGFILIFYFKKLLKKFSMNNFFKTLQIIFNKYKNTKGKWSERKFCLFFIYKI